jgi:transcription elongation factor SPT6
MARKVEELMASDRFKHGSEDDLRKRSSTWLKDKTDLHLHRSFSEKFSRCESREEHVWFHTESEKTRPLQPLLPCQQELHGSNLGTSTSIPFSSSLTLFQPVRVTPEAYYLFDAAALGVPELCDAFKVR